MVYSGDPLRHLLKKGEDYGNVRTLYVVCILGGHLLVRDEDKSFRHSLLRYAHVTMADSRKVLSNKLNFIFLQLPGAREVGTGSPFIEKVAYAVRNMVNMESQPEALRGDYFEALFEASRRTGIKSDKLQIYDTMIRDEIQIQAEKEYAIQEGREEGRAMGIEEGRAVYEYDNKHDAVASFHSELGKAMKSDLYIDCLAMVVDSDGAIYKSEKVNGKYVEPQPVEEPIEEVTE